MYNVFLVDDEPFIIEGMKSIINWEDIGLQIIGHAYDGEEALKTLQTKECNILLTDIMMPQMNGLELITALKVIKPHMKYIVLSGYQEFEYVKKGISLGIENYLLKPIDEEELAATLRNTIEKLQQLQHEDEDYYVLRDNAIWRWLNRDISHQELKNRLDIYDLHLHDSTLVFAIVQLELAAQHRGERSGIRKWIEECMGCLCVINPEEEMILIWLSKRPDEVERDLHHLQMNLDQKQEVQDYFIALGKENCSSDDIFLSFYRTRDLLKYRFVISEGTKLILEKDAEKFSETTEMIRTFNFQELLKQVLTGNHCEVEKWIHSAFDQFSERISLDTSQLAKSFSIELMSTIRSSLDLPNDLMKLAKETTSVLQADTITELRNVVIAFLINLIEQIKNRNDQMSPIIHSVLQYIQTSYHEELSLKTLSQKFHVNTIYLGQLFQKEVGSVFSDYINQLRIEKAKMMLKESHLKSGEIGKKVGYSDSTYFYKQFKKSMGVTPTEWRALHSYESQS
ncbi:response regulator transcription factor [Metabacillus dongyingensis]|uniref:response regulator transcription factor n=1 Tax=Metabacillus dongyingensis TaxID=2874282 RepID=UPI003B8AC866